jgi:importin subunit beta-1
MPNLLSFITAPDAAPASLFRKEATLTAIGYICEEMALLNSNVLAAQSNTILTAVVAGIQIPGADESIKVAAIRALSNALDFAKPNFEVDVRSTPLPLPLPS